MAAAVTTSTRIAAAGLAAAPVMAIVNSVKAESGA
jgi:hypothetical protein